MPKLSHDLVLIRKEMRLSKQNVFEKCRIPMETIDAIEDGSIFTGKTRNKTYQRSFLRSYAKAIRISENDIFQALNEQESAQYDGSLAEKYLARNGKPEEDAASSDPEKASASDPGEESQIDPEKDSKNSIPKSPGKKTAGDIKSGGSISNTAQGTSPFAPNPVSGNLKSGQPVSKEKTLEEVEWEDKSLKKPLSTSTSGFASSESYKSDIPSQKLPPPPDLATVDWATKVKDAIYRPQRNRLLWVIVAIILALALATASIIWYWQREDIQVSVVPLTEQADPSETGDPTASTDDEPASGEILPPPELAVSDPEQESAETSADDPAIALSLDEIAARVLEGTVNDDTLFVIAYALHGNLEPIRIYSDVFTNDDATTTLRPYWVEHQQAMRFEFVDEIVFQGTLSRLVLIFNGHVIDDFNDLYQDGSRISLNREYIMGNEELHIPNETPFAMVPTPRAIEDRPRFSP